MKAMLIVLKAMNNIKQLVDNTESNLNILPESSGYNKAKTEENVKHIVKELMSKNPFLEEQEELEFESFPQFNQNTLGNLDTTKFLKWANKTTKETKSLIELEW